MKILIFLYACISLGLGLELSTDIDVSEGKIYVTSDKNDLKNCSISKNNAFYAPDIKYIWEQKRGYFIANTSGVYVVNCNANQYVSNISVVISGIPRNTVAPDYSDNLNAKWERVNIYARSNLDSMASFFVNDPLKVNVSYEEALQYLDSVKDTYGPEQIYIEPVDVVQENDKVSEHKSSMYRDSVTPLYDGMMGWMKALNFSAHVRLCGRGSNVHLLSESYVFTHEDNKNPAIRAYFPAMPGCENFTQNCDSGTAALGLLAAMKNSLGIEGLARCADSINLYRFGQYQQILERTKPGDLIGLSVQYVLQKQRYPFFCLNPGVVKAMHESGAIVVQAAASGLTDLMTLEECKTKVGAQYGFVATASVRDSDSQRDMALSDNGPDKLSNYNHPNCVNAWGNFILTTLSTNTIPRYSFGRNRGYGHAKGTASSVAIILGTLSVLQGYFRMRCPQYFLNYNNLMETIQKTGFQQQVPYKMGYSPDINSALKYIDEKFVTRCPKAIKFTVKQLETKVPSYDDRVDAWWEDLSISHSRFRCQDRNYTLAHIPMFMTEDFLLRITKGQPEDIIICTYDGAWKEVVYLPVLSTETLHKLQGTRLIFIRDSTFDFRIVRTFGNETWTLPRKAQIRLILNEPHNLKGFSSNLI